jgi:hypothetical protein
LLIYRVICVDEDTTLSTPTSAPTPAMPSLGDPKDGEVREICGRVLRDQLGPKLTEAAHADLGHPEQ